MKKDEMANTGCALIGCLLMILIPLAFWWLIIAALVKIITS